MHYSSTDTTIVINWKTSHSADSHIRWGKNKNLEKEKNNNNNEKKHRVVLRELEPDNAYYFRIKSTDENDNSDSSRIYSVSTKQASAIFAKRQWENFDKEVDNEQTYEKVNVEVTDKSEMEIRKKEKPISIEINKNVGVEKDSGPSSAARIFSGAKNGLSGFFSGLRELAVGTQRKIVGFFKLADEQIADVRDSILAKLSKEKATEIARINRAKFFTTQVFSRDEKKLLAEVRFQILDKKDDPIPNLETMLFSDPQSAVTNEDGVATFHDVPIGSHTLAFDYQDEKIEKKVAIADTLTDEGKVRAEVVQVKAEKEKIALWMWLIIVLLVFATIVAAYFAGKYYNLKKHIEK